MKQVAGTRIVTVSSGVSNQGKIEFDNLQTERVYKPMFQAYSQSKLANLIFAQNFNGGSRPRGRLFSAQPHTLDMR